MRIENYKDWKEVISINEFHGILKELIVKKDSFSQTDLLEILSLLSEKYLLFYRTTELTNEEKTFINSALIKATDFSNLFINEELIGIMFNYRLDDYFFYLKKNINLVKVDEVRNEILNSLKEYKEGK